MSMKSADEIKKGLRCPAWVRNHHLPCSECDYHGQDKPPCAIAVHEDAIALIQQLEDHLREATKMVEQIEAERDGLSIMLTSATSAAETYKRERDAAVADLRRAMHCPSCVNWRKPEKAAVCIACQYGRTRRFEWRGVQKEK